MMDKYTFTFSHNWEIISQETDNVEDFEFENGEGQCENLYENEGTDKEDNVSNYASLQNEVMR